jgi:hypothetical protein
MNEDINVRDYCLIGMGNIEEIKEDLLSISDTTVNFVSGEGIIITTFKSSFLIGEIEEFLKMNERAYIIFEMNYGFFSANLGNQEFQKALFGGEIDNSKFPQQDFNVFINIIKQDFETKSLLIKSDEDLLEDAIRNEDYIKAAYLRDKITSMKK